ncbi:MAG: DNA polymerase III subunit beta [Clostridia bacterium]|nr:DNA polymerase III subunit beta [Clostridia bacterium]
MIITFEKEKFLEKLYPSMATVSNKSTVVSIEGVLIETMDEGRLRLTTYDMIKGVRSYVEDVEITEGGRYIINATRLLQIVKVFPDHSRVTISVDEKLGVKISSGKASFSLFAMRGEDFPSLPDLGGEYGFSISSGVLKRMINKTLHSVAVQDQRPVLCGAYFHIEKDLLDVTSCDSFTLSKCMVKCKVEDICERTAFFKGGVLSVNVPGHALSEVVRLLDDDDEPVNIYVGYRHAVFHTGGVIFFTRLIDGEYIDYNRLLPKDQSIFLKVNRERFLQSLERASLVAEEKFAGAGRSYVKLTVKDNTLIVTSSSANGKIYDELECEHEGGEIEIGFNCRLLLNSVRAADSEELLVTMKGPLTSITVEPAEKNEDKDFFYMVLPVRMAD